MAVIIPAVAGKVIHIGRAGENLATTVQFDVSDWIRDFGNSGTFNLYVQQGGNYTYPVTLDITQLSNGVVLWHVNENNTAMVGLGKCELAYTLAGGDASTTSDDLRVKSIIYDIAVTNSLDAEVNENPPDAIQSWLATVDSALTEATSGQQWATGGTGGTPGPENNAKYYSQQAEAWATGGSNGTPSAINNAKYYSEQAADAAGRVEGLDAGNVTTLAPGSAATVTRRTEEASGSTPEHYEFDFGIPRGSKWFYGSSAPSTSSPSEALSGDFYLRNNASYPYVYTFDGSTWTQGMSVKGSTGTRGSKWYAGTSITGTSTTATIFSGSGISSAIVDDQYLNTETGNTYKCTVAGAASAAKWIYTGNIRGIQGIQGIQGETGHGLEITRIFQGTSTSAFGSTFVAQGTIYGLKTSLSDTSETPKLYIQNAASGSNSWVYIGKQGGAQAELYTWS